MIENSGDQIRKKKPGRLILWADEKPTNPTLFRATIHSFIRVLLISLQEFKRNNLSLRSGALTYTILLSLVPMLAMSTAVVKGLGGGNQLRRVVYSYIDTLDNRVVTQDKKEIGTDNQAFESQQDGPTSNLTDHIYSVADKLFAYVERTNFATLGTIGVIGIFLSVILVLSYIEMAMNAIWHVPSGRSFLRKIADYLTLIILFPLSINIGFAASAILKNPALFAKIETLLPMVWVQAFLLKLVPIFFITLTLYVTYLFFPNTKVRNRAALIGALIAGFLWIYAQNIYFHLQIGVANYNAIYGSFATLPLFLIWLYVGWLFILTGAQIAFAFQNRDHYQLIPKPTQPVLLLSAAFDIVSYIYQSFNKKQPINHHDIYADLREYDDAHLDQAIDLLLAENIISRSETDAQLLPCGPADKTDHKEIILAILGKSTPDTPGGLTSKQIIDSALLEPADNNKKGDDSTKDGLG